MHPMRLLVLLAAGVFAALPGFAANSTLPAADCPTRTEDAVSCTTLVECDENGTCLEFCAGCTDADGNLLPCL